MWIKQITLVSLLSIAPVMSYADIVVTNNTDYYGTGEIPFVTPCSSAAGDKGIIKPKSSFNVPQSAIDSFCGAWGCDVALYIGKNCNTKVATAKLNSKGITQIKNLSNKVRISGSGKSASIDPV